MSAYPLTAIRSLRLRKEEEAERKLAAARSLEKMRREELKAAQKKLDDYLAWNEREAERLFGEITNTTSTLRHVVDTTTTIKWNRSQQATHVLNLEECNKRLEEAVAEVAVCQRAQEVAAKEVWKIDNHRSRWLTEEKLRIEGEEEAEMEEVAAVSSLYRSGGFKK